MWLSYSLARFPQKLTWYGVDWGKWFAYPSPRRTVGSPQVLPRMKGKERFTMLYPNTKGRFVDCHKILPGWHQFWDILGFVRGWDIFFTRWCQESGTVGCSTSDGYGLWRNQSKAGICLELGRFKLLKCVVQAIPQHSSSLIGLVPARIPIEHNVSNFCWIPRR